jgi:MFS family permease
LDVTDAALGGVTAVYLIIVAISAVFWGYRGDRARRKPLLFWGTLLWVSMMILTGLAQNFTQFMLFQIGTAVGVGSISSVGFSVVSDVIPAHRRGVALSLWSVSQGLGYAFGSLLASILGANNWRIPFFVIASLGIIFAILYRFTQEPERGQAEPELAPLFASGEARRRRPGGRSTPHGCQRGPFRGGFGPAGPAGFVLQPEERRCGQVLRQDCRNGKERTLTAP